jgi:hypothetical protein
VAFDMRRQVQRHQFSLFHHELAAHHGVVGAYRRAARQRRHWVVQRPSIGELVQIDGEEVGALAGFERTDVFAAQHGCPVPRGYAKSLASCHQRLLMKELASLKQEQFLTDHTLAAKATE